MTPETITITKQELHDAFAEWETQHRNGECCTYEEMAALSVEKVAQENAEHFWRRLSGK